MPDFEAFPKVPSKYYLEPEASVPCPIEQAKIKAIFYLDVYYNGKYGFFAEAHDNENTPKSISGLKIPTSFESALLLPYIMNEGVDQLVVENLISVLKRQIQSSGFWNLFSNTDLQFHSPMPNNVDNTALAAMALYNTGTLSLNECRVVGQKIGERLSVEPQQVPKLCVGVVTNLLWLLATIGMETEPQFLDSVKYVHTFVDNLVENKCKDGLKLPCMRFYTNKYIHLFFIARFLRKSEYVKETFGQKFVNLLVSELEDFLNKPKSEALDVAFMIFAVWHLGLHKFGEQNKWLGYEREIVKMIRENVTRLCERLLSLQDRKDGSFRAWVTYRWNNTNHWRGSKAMTTGFVLAALGIAKTQIYEEMDLSRNGDSSDGQSSNDEGTQSR